MIEYLDRPPSGWRVLDVMRSSAGVSDWVALMVDGPTESWRWRRECWVTIAGSHISREAALDALQAMMATRH